MIYFNEIDSYAAAWLRNLFPGAAVDERDVREVSAADVTRFKRCHFFGGIGGWEFALRLADWPDDEEVWTGSCPCQPFSVAGKGAGVRDSRHLWPAFHALIAERRPATIFGEQVASTDGRIWLARVRADLEELGYAVGAADLCAAGVGAPHIRQRLYWMALADGAERRPHAEGWEDELDGADAGRSQASGGCGVHRETDGMAEPKTADWRRGESAIESETRIGRRGLGGRRSADGMEFAASDGRQQGRTESVRGRIEPRCEFGGLGDTGESRRQGREPEIANGTSREARRPAAESGTLSCWRDSELILCRDEKYRRVPVEPAFQPLADGFSGSRIGALRAAGNAIAPILAAEFIRAAREFRQ